MPLCSDGCRFLYMLLGHLGHGCHGYAPVRDEFHGCGRAVRKSQGETVGASFWVVNVASTCQADNRTTSGNITVS